MIADGSGPFAFAGSGVERAGISGTSGFGARNGARTVRPRWLRVGVPTCLARSSRKTASGRSDCDVRIDHITGEKNGEKTQTF